LALSGLAFEGGHHRAIDDARNIARLAMDVICRE
jgi:inhibitor of KinA sporulation pathway (predicted exonuclease)